MPISEAKKRSNAAYNRRQDNIMLRPSKEDGARIRKAAADAGKSVQRYCLDILLKSVPDEVPNAETQAAIDEVDNMVRTSKGEHFSGTTEELFKKRFFLNQMERKPPDGIDNRESAHTSQQRRNLLDGAFTGSLI